MDKWKKKLSGALIASVLALTLSSKAFADPADESVPDLPVPQYEEKATDAGSSNTPATVSSSSDNTETPKTDTSSRDITPESKGPAEVKSASLESTSLNTESNLSDNDNKVSSASSGSSEPASKTTNSEGSSGDTPKGASASENGSAGADSSAPVTVTNIVTDIENNTNVTVDNVTNGEGRNVPSTLTLTDGRTVPGSDNENGGNTVFTRNASFNSNSSQSTDPDNLSGDSEIDPAGQTRSGGESDPAENSGSEEPGTITLGSTTFTPGQDPSTDLSSTTTAEDDSFGFDAGATDAASDDSFYMVDYDGSSQTLASTNSDINIKAAGLNRLRSIQADGDVNITGTGILLVDSLSISENHNFFLHPIEGIYDSGSVAVFLRQQVSDDPEGGPGGDASGTGAPAESDSEGSSPSASAPKSVYMLINGPAVPGILDEKYTLPENVSLIVPDNSSLILQSTVQETVRAHEEDGEEVPESVTVYTTTPDYNNNPNSSYCSYKYSAPNLTIPASSGLTLESGASLTSNYVVSPYGHAYQSLITVNGTLDSGGMITRGAIVLNSTATASAVFGGCQIYNNAQNAILTIRNSCSLISSNGSSLGSVFIAEGAELNCYANTDYESGCTVTFNSGITNNGSIQFHSGDYHIYNNSSLAEEKGVPIVADPGNTIMPASNAIPVMTMEISTSSAFIPSDAYLWRGKTVADTGILEATLVSNGNLYFSSLAEKYGESYTLIEVYTVSNNKMVKHVITSASSTGYVPIDQVWLIRLVTIVPGTTNSGGGGSVMSTNTSITGSGILGGSGAGSMNGGAGTQIDLSSFNTGSNQSNGNGESGNGNTQDNGNTQGNGNENSGNGNSQSDSNGDSGNGSNQGNDSSGNGAGNNNTGDNSSTDNQTNANGGNHVNNDPSPDDTYITPEDIKPDVKPEDLVITVTEQETVSVSSNANSQTASTPQTTVSLEEAAPVYTLTVTVDNQQVTKLNEKITVRFSCPAPKTNRQIFAVFRDKDGSLKAFKAKYDKVKKQLVFDTDMLGDFAVICTDFKGKLDSEEFYKYLETFDTVKALS